MESEDTNDPMEYEVDKLLNDPALKINEFLVKAGMPDASWMARKSWTWILRTSTKYLILTCIPKHNERPVTAVEILGRMGCTYNEGNLRRNLNELEKWWLIESEMDVSGDETRRVFKLTPSGELCLKHSPYVTKSDLHKEMVKLTKENLKLREELMELKRKKS